MAEFAYSISNTFLGSLLYRPDSTKDFFKRLLGMLIVSVFPLILSLLLMTIFPGWAVIPFAVVIPILLLLWPDFTAKKKKLELHPLLHSKKELSSQIQLIQADYFRNDFSNWKLDKPLSYRSKNIIRIFPETFGKSHYRMVINYHTTSHQIKHIFKKLKLEDMGEWQIIVIHQFDYLKNRAEFFEEKLSISESEFMEDLYSEYAANYVEVYERLYLMKSQENLVRLSTLAKERKLEEFSNKLKLVDSYFFGKDLMYSSRSKEWLVNLLYMENIISFYIALFSIFKKKSPQRLLPAPKYKSYK